jgi:hypothetical protein
VEAFEDTMIPAHHLLTDTHQLRASQLLIMFALLVPVFGAATLGVSWFHRPREEFVMMCAIALGWIAFVWLLVFIAPRCFRWLRAGERRQRITALFGANEDQVRRLHVTQGGEVAFWALARCDDPVFADSALTTDNGVATISSERVPDAFFRRAAVMLSVDVKSMPEERRQRIRRELGADCPDPISTRIRRFVLGEWPASEPVPAPH